LTTKWNEEQYILKICLRLFHGGGERQGRLPSFYKLTRKGSRDQPDPYHTYISIWLHQHLAYIGFHTRFL